jgi:hypothetical protein
MDSKKRNGSLGAWDWFYVILCFVVLGMLLYAATMNYVEVVPSGEVKVHHHG